MKTKYFKNINYQRNNMKGILYYSFYPSITEHHRDKIVQLETQSYIKFDVHSIPELKEEIKLLKYNIKQSLSIRNFEFILNYNLIVDLPAIESLPISSNKVRSSLQLSLTMTLSKSIFDIEKQALNSEIETIVDLISLFGFDDGKNYKIYKTEK